MEGSTKLPQAAAAQPQPPRTVGPLRRLAKQTFDAYVPPHVQQRPWKPPTSAGVKAGFHRLVHLPGLPILRWARTYTREDMWADLIGGFTVAVMLVPQGLAFAITASLPPVLGLYNATLPPIFYTLFGTSRHLSVGPGALISVFFPEACAGLGLSLDVSDAEATARRAQAASVLSFWVGVIFLVCGLLRVSKVLRFLSHSVMTGFTSGAAFYLGFAQLRLCLGIKTPAFAHNHEMYTYVAEHGLRDGDRHTQAIAATTFFVLYGLKVLKRDYLPPTPARFKSVVYRAFVQFVTFSTVIVVVATALWARALHAAGHTQVAVVGDIVQGWNPVKSVAVGAFGVQAELGAALPLALIGFLEAFSMARKFALANKYDVDMNQEAAALGLANLLSCPFSIFPATGNFGRTALANDVGVKSQAANVVMGIVISVVLSRLTGILYYIPKGTLGAVVCSAMITLCDWPEFILAFWVSPLYFLVMSFTFLVTAAVDVALGLQLGLALSVTMLLFRLASLERHAMGQLPHGDDNSSQCFVPLDRYPEATERPGIKVFRLTGYLWFGNAAKMRDQAYALMVKAYEEDTSGGLTHVVLDVSGCSGVDLTTLLSLQYLLTEARRLGVRLVLAECSDGVRRKLGQAGLLEAVGGELTGRCLEEVVAALEEERRKKLQQAKGGKGDVEAGMAAMATGAGTAAEADAKADAKAAATHKKTPLEAFSFYKRLVSPAAK